LKKRRAFTPALILFIALPEGEGKPDPWMTPFPLRMLPRRCPVCGNRTIVGHGIRRKQAHDLRRDRIWIRRGRCGPCRKTFTILPVWSPPYGHYSLECRQQAWLALREATSWEDAVPNVKELNRLPDPSTVRRWALQLFCFGLLLSNIFRPPTILAWDWSVIRSMLPLEANSS
jgi:hypothetical protein